MQNRSLSGTLLIILTIIALLLGCKMYSRYDKMQNRQTLSDEDIYTVTATITAVNDNKVEYTYTSPSGRVLTSTTETDSKVGKAIQKVNVIVVCAKFDLTVDYTGSRVDINDDIEETALAMESYKRGQWMLGSCIGLIVIINIILVIIGLHNTRLNEERLHEDAVSVERDEPPSLF